MSKKTACDVINFRGGYDFATTNPDGRWKITDTSSAGTPTYTGANLGGLVMTLSSTSEIQNVCLDFGDVLGYDIDELLRMEFIAKVNAAAIDSTTQIAMGMASARNDAIDSIAAAALFRMVGSDSTTAVVVETDDGTNDNDDKATGQTLGTSYKAFAIDFSQGVYSQDPPNFSTGGKGAVQFYMSNAYGSLERVAQNTAFDMSNYSAGLQPYFQIQKTADTNVNALTILRVKVTYKLPVG